mgnify:CR=1 FL=1
MRRQWRGDVVCRSQSKEDDHAGRGRRGESGSPPYRRRRRVVVIDAHQICAAVVDSVDPAPPPLPSRPPRPLPLRIQAVALASSSTAAQDPCRHHGLLDIRAALVFVVEVGGEAGGSGVRRRCGERPEAAAAPVELAEVGWVGKVERGCACAVVWGCLGSKVGLRFCIFSPP